MSPQEWFWELEVRMEQSLRATPGMGGISEWEWLQARMKHREKMKQNG